MSTDLKGIMRTHGKLVEIVNDPDLTSDAKLFATCLLVDIDDRRVLTKAERRLRGSWSSSVGALAGRDANWVKYVIGDDIPRYTVDRGTGVCVGEMIRREGPCGKRAYESVVDIDPLTGLSITKHYCTRHWNLDYRDEARRLYREWVANDKPSPPPNAGGTLKRHFSTDWHALYKWARPHREPLEGAKEPTLPRPTLSLIQGGA